LRLLAFQHYSQGSIRCECCGEVRLPFLTIDHVEGGGSSHRRELNSSIYKWLKKTGYPSGFRILCYNCNMAYAFLGFCPHKL
jgi:hypothetical protein